MTGTESTRGKFRAIFFSAIMIMSMVAMSAAFAGTAAASANSVSADNSPTGEVDITVTHANADSEIGFVIDFNESGKYNQTEDVFVNGSAESGGSTTLTANISSDTDPENYDVFASADTSVTEPSDGSDLSSNFDVENTNEVVVDDVNYVIVIEDSSGDLAANPNSPITVEATITNTGDIPSSGQDINVNNSDSSSPAFVDSVTIGSSLALDAGETQTVNGTLTAADPDLSSDDSVDRDYEIGTQNDTVTNTLTIAEDGFIQGDVRNTDNNPLSDANVTATNTDTDQVFNTTTDNNGAFTIAVPANDTYDVEVDQQGFQSFSTQRTVTPGGTERIDVTLESNLFAEKVGVALWDSEEQQTVGDAAALLADGDFDNNVELVVYAQSQLNTSLDSDTTATLDVADASNGELDSANNIFNAGEGVYLNEATGDTSEDEITRTLNGSTTLDVSNFDTDVDENPANDATVGDSEFGDGDVSYATFNVTAGNVTEDEVREFADAVAQGNITATIENTGEDADKSITDTSDITYFVEGEKSTQHQVLNTDGDPIEGATVYVSYAGAPQNLEDVEQFQNDAGESFLVADTNEDGIAVIPGLVPGVQYNAYVIEDGFNIFNSSTAPAGAGSPQDNLTTETGIDADTFVADYTLDQTIDESSDGAGFAQVYGHTLRQTPQDIALDVTVADADGNQVKSTDVPDGNIREVQVSATAGEIGQDVSEFGNLSGQTIDLELTDDAAGELVGANDDGVVQVTTDQNGIATAQFEAVQGQDRNTNVTASTENADNDVYATSDTEGQDVNDDGNQAEIDVFTTGTLTGDVLDQNEIPIEGANVTIERLNESNNEFEQIRDVRVTSASGQYVFEDLETGEEYRVNGEFEGDTGFATRADLQPGTNTRDVVISEADVGDGNTPEAPTTVTLYDDDNDGEITASELGEAVTDFGEGELTASELGEVVTAFGQS
jgi:surface glycoprotein (TIGR04207 family)